MAYRILWLFFITCKVSSESNTLQSLQRSLAFQTLKPTINTTKNTMVFVLPLQFSLCKLASIAEGDAKNELLKATGFTNNKEVNTFYSKFRDIFERISHLDFIYVNKLYVNYSDDIDPNFFTNSSVQFGVHVDKVGFNYPKSAAAFINKKISSTTLRRIGDVVQAPDIDNATTMLLITAAHYKPTWGTPFNPSLTKARTFRRLSGKISNIPMMTQTGEFYYYNARDYEILAIDTYGFHMIFVKPTFVNLARVLDKFEANPDLLSNIIMQLKPKELKIVIPRMKVQSQLDLTNVLKQIGLKEVLNSSSTGLNNILREGIKSKNIIINKVIQKLILEVDEFGNYRSRMLRQNVHPVSPYLEEFILDRPFYFIGAVGLTIYDTVREGPAKPPRSETYDVFNGVFYGPE